MYLDSNGNLTTSTIALTATAVQTSSQRQVLVGSNNNACQYGQVQNFNFKCGAGGFGWGAGCWMNTIGGQTNSSPAVFGGLNTMVKDSAFSSITINGTFSGYLGNNIMGIIVYVYNNNTGQYYFIGETYQFQNIGSNHACGGASIFHNGQFGQIPAGPYYLYIGGRNSIATDTNDFCYFNAMISP